MERYRFKNLHSAEVLIPLQKSPIVGLSPLFILMVVRGFSILLTVHLIKIRSYQLMGGYQFTKLEVVKVRHLLL